VWHCATILWRIAYSGMLRHHLAVLNKKNWLVVPIYNKGNIELFQNFTGFNPGTSVGRINPTLEFQGL
jgi:hypothetical protein